MRGIAAGPLGSANYLPSVLLGVAAFAVGVVVIGRRFVEGWRRWRAGRTGSPPGGSWLPWLLYLLLVVLFLLGFCGLQRAVVTR